MSANHFSSPSTKSGQSLKRGLILVMIALALTPALLIGVFSHQQTSKSLKQEVFNSLNQTADMAVELVIEWFHVRQLDVESLASTRLVVPVTAQLTQLLNENEGPILELLKSPEAQAISESSRKLLSGYHERYQYIEDIYIVSLAGDIILTTRQEAELGKNIDDVIFSSTRFARSVREVIESGETQFSDLELWPNSDDQHYGFFITPIFNPDREIIGAFSIRANLVSLMNTLQGMQNENKLRYIAGEDGKLRSSDNTKGHREKAITTQIFTQWQQSHLTGYQNPEPAIYISHTGKRVIGSIKDIDVLGLHWAYISEADAASALSVANHVSGLTAIVLLLTTIATIVLIQYLSGRIIQPLEDLSVMVTNIAEGGESKPVEIHNNDEIGQLSLAFNSMMSARLKYEQQLEESHLFNEQILSAATEFAIIATDTQGTITHFNTGAERLLGYKSEELLHKETPLVFHDSQELKLRARELSEELSQGIDDFQSLVIMSEKYGSETREWKMRRNDEEVLDVRLTVTTIRDHSQNISGYLGIAQDISSSKKTEQLLTRLSRIAQETNNGVVVTDKEGKIEWVNQGFITVTGYTLEESLGKKPGSFLQGKDTDAKTVEFIHKALIEEQEFTVEILNYHKSGTPYWLEITCNPLYSVSGELEGFMAIETDITERKRNQKEHQNTLRYNKALADLTTDRSIMSGSLTNTKEKITEQIAGTLKSARASIWMFDNTAQHLECIDQYSSETQAHVTGIKILRKHYPYYFASVLRHSIIAVDDVFSHSSTTEFVETYLKSNGITSVLNAVISSSEGIVGVVSIEHIGTPKKWSSAEISFASAISTFISGICEADQRREIQKQLIAAKDAAEQADQAKSEFLAIMSHEIRTPMNGVIGMLNLLKRSQLNDTQLRQAGIAQSSAKSLLFLINDILDFSKVEAGKLDLEEVEFDLRSCIENVVESMAIKAEEKSIELVLDLSQIEHFWMKGDPGRIRQIFINLIGNALKFTHRGEIIISCSAQKANEQYRVTACVKDTGIGIAPDKIDNLFDSFTQADASTTRQYGGTGLGLAICKRLCHMMGGDIEAASIPNQGSEFRFTLELAACEPRTRAIPKTSLNHKRILVVDDNDTNREILRIQLKAWGAEVTECDSGKQALDICEQTAASPFDAAILDMQMPHMDGAELGPKIHKIIPSTGLIMMTSQAMRNDAKRFSELGFQAYFTKPVTMSDLHDALTIVLDKGDCLKQASPLVTTHYIRSLVNSNIEVEDGKTLDWGDQQRLLLVEDNAINQEVASLMLEDLGLTTDIASNGLEALSALKSAPEESPYTLIFMDCQMPEMDGYQASEAIRKLDAGSRYAVIPIVAMTANAMKGDREKCLNAGMSDYLTKPIDPDELLSMLIKWIKPKSAPRQEEPSVSPHAEIPETSGLPIWNKDSAFKRVGRKESRLVYLAQLFLKDMPARIEDIKRAVTERDITAILTTAHAAKGVAMNLSLERFADTAKELEDAARNGNLDECIEKHGVFIDNFDQANLKLANYMKEHTAQ